MFDCVDFLLTLLNLSLRLVGKAYILVDESKRKGCIYICNRSAHDLRPYGSWKPTARNMLWEHCVEIPPMEELELKYWLWVMGQVLFSLFYYLYFTKKGFTYRLVCYLYLKESLLMLLFQQRQCIQTIKISLNVLQQHLQQQQKYVLKSQK